MSLNLNSHNHNQHAGRPCFSLAVLIEGSTSTPRCDIFLPQNRVSHVCLHTIHVHADRSPLHRSMTSEPSRALHGQAMPMTIARHCKHRPPHDLRIWGDLLLIFIQLRKYDGRRRGHAVRVAMEPACRHPKICKSRPKFIGRRAGRFSHPMHQRC
jgi:hypothetical protein